MGVPVEIARRDFLKSAVACGLGGAGIELNGSRSPLTAAQDIPLTSAGIPRLLSGCSAYSFRKQLMSGQMTMEDFIRRAVELRLDGVDMTVYYLKSTEPAYLESLRYLAYKNAVAVIGAACGARMVQADPARRADVVNDIKKWVDVAGWLGVPQLRILAGNLPQGVSLKQATDWVVEMMKSAVEYSAGKGISLSLENNRGVTQNADTCLEVIHRVDSPYAGITLDITHFVPTPSQDAYSQIAACIPYATNAHILDRFDDEAPIDLERIWKLFTQAGFKGYMSLEFDPRPGAEDTSDTEIRRMISEIRALCRKYSSTSS
ncbi:MAG: sugar phosphate isomerase/epimerase [Formivibrio sp.]|nr:sugar phosphate isomerase/epimerase [Formivibrio sp.]